MTAVAGHVVLVRYHGAQMWHERLLLAVVSGPEFVVVTPTWDYFAEEIAMTNPDLSGLTQYLPDGTRPQGVGPHHVFGFAAIDAIHYQHLMVEGEHTSVMM
ncbi:unnamed protein product [Polarella glacialis]|uniref:Uncharacterized protein n=1 Tax=Polarella glacialis TaxID=89957 RepID=A0A813GTD5_POLGL|nr:unnamed protein product [Polarella glacialis]